MAETNYKQIWRRVVRVVLSLGSEGRNPAFAWKGLVTILVIGILGAGVVGYAMYFGAVKDKGQVVSDTRPPRNPLNPTEINAVILRYAAKDEHLNALIADEPTYLSPGRGSGAKPAVSESPSTSTPTLSQ